MANPGAGVCESTARYRNKLPIVAGGMKGQLEDPERIDILNYTVRPDGPRDACVVGAASPDHDLRYAAHRIGNPGWCLRRKAFIHVIVSR